MTPQEVLDGIIAGFNNIGWTEGLAVIFATISVLCSRANSIWVYPTGIISILLGISIFIDADYNLYPDAALNIYYLTMSIYGWYYWKKGKKNTEKETKITSCSTKELMIASSIFLVLWGALYWALSTYNINNVPMMDSFTSSIAASGMWLLAKRKIENWIAFFLADFVAIGLFFYKGLFLFSLLNVLYVVICVSGYRLWKKRIWSGMNLIG